MKAIRFLFAAMILLGPVGLNFSELAAEPAQTEFKLAFGPGNAPPGYLRVSPTQAYSKEAGYGFEGVPKISEVDRGGENPLHAGFCTSENPFFFSVALPEGNYKVTVTLGDAQGESTTTIKSELRRLMLEQIHTRPGEFISRSFIANIRTPIYPGGNVHLKSPRETKDEAWAWDEKLTLEINGKPACLAAMEISKVDVPTIYILGDSTVCDQSKEPYASWGQMLPRFFKPEVAVANHAESGETLSSSQGAHRFDKVLSAMKPEDILLIQFGHNDMKSKGADASEQYKSTLKKWVAEVKKKGGIPVLITPVNRHSFQGAEVVNSLRDYPDKVREAAKEEGVAMIDLNAMSKTLYEALGPTPSIQLFEHNADASKFDGTHHSPYGAYELAKCVIEGMKNAKLEVVKLMVDGVPVFDPAKPDPVSAFGVPPSPGAPGLRPLGD